MIGFTGRCFFQALFFRDGATEAWRRTAHVYTGITQRWRNSRLLGTAWSCALCRELLLVRRRPPDFNAL